MPDLDDDASLSLKERMISAYDAVLVGFPHASAGLTTFPVTLTPMQCATILSSLRHGLQNSFGEEMPNAPKDEVSDA
jgi:hypothetical protein